VKSASHIKPYAQQGPHEVKNGLLLRQDIHTLFDRGYLTITNDYHIEVSRRIKEDYGICFAFGAKEDCMITDDEAFSKFMEGINDVNQRKLGGVFQDG
jgi:hypothetical protein